MNYYVYYSYEEWGRGYIGARTCKCLPEEDTKYFGSFKDKTFKPTQKIILQTFNTYKESIEAEVILHKFYEVDVNPHFANRAKQTSTGFTTSGLRLPQSKEHREKIGFANKGRVFSQKHRDNLSRSHLGNTHSIETRKKMRDIRLGEKHPMYRKKWFTNGIKNIRADTCPEGYIQGFTKKKHKPKV